MEHDEALIRAREAVIAAGYVVGLDPEQQIRAGQHDEWLVTKIAYNALITQDLDVDILKKYHAPGQLALAKAEQRPVVIRARRSAWNVLCVKVARWWDKRSHYKPPITDLHAQVLAQTNEIARQMARHRDEINEKMKKANQSFSGQGSIASQIHAISQGRKARSGTTYERLYY